ncbi:phenylacetic acid degradation bifunctional protein PaaZ [Sesbania bispinosa]|nr:phenylacetic acid degradation bifunctional protein PaaZ [Sesbania bispinosa]
MTEQAHNIEMMFVMNRWWSSSDEARDDVHRDAATTRLVVQRNNEGLMREAHRWEYLGACLKEEVMQIGRRDVEGVAEGDLREEK